MKPPAFVFFFASGFALMAALTNHEQHWRVAGAIALIALGVWLDDLGKTIASKLERNQE